jgi:hypothetical protein
MDPELKQKIEEQGIKIDAIYESVEKTRRYFLIMTWVTIIVIVLPIIGIAFTLPGLIDQYSDLSNIIN